MNDETNRDRRYPPDDGSGPRNGAHPSVEMLSEYLDTSEELTMVERDAIEGHLSTCEGCQTTLQELRMMVQTLNALPEREAPRRFALTPEMLEPAKTPEHPAPVILQESTQWHARHAAKVRWATAVAAMLFVFVISADLVTNGLGERSGSSNDDAAGNTMSVRQAEDDAEGDTTFGFNEEEEAAEEEAQPTPASAADDSAGSEEAPPAEDAEGETSASDEAASGEVAESEDAPAEESDEALRTTDEDASDGAGASDDDMSTMRIDEFSEEPMAETEAQVDSGQMTWRILEVSLALVLALLLAVMIGLPKQRGARRR